MTTTADQIEELLSSMAPLGYLGSTLLIIGMVALCIRFVVHSGRSVG